jgi:hypothetical protein
MILALQDLPAVGQQQRGGRHSFTGVLQRNVRRGEGFRAILLK